jgi:hypothetical protein
MNNQLHKELIFEFVGAGLPANRAGNQTSPKLTPG